MDSIKERVGAFIERTGMSKEEMADRIGISRGALYSKLKGESEFSLSEAKTLSRLLGCSTDDLFVSPFERSK